MIVHHFDVVTEFDAVPEGWFRYQNIYLETVKEKVHLRLKGNNLAIMRRRAINDEDSENIKYVTTVGKVRKPWKTLKRV